MEDNQSTQFQKPRQTGKIRWLAIIVLIIVVAYLSYRHNASIQGIHRYDRHFEKASQLLPQVKKMTRQLTPTRHPSTSMITKQFTIQLTGSHNYHHIIQFINDHNLQKTANILSSRQHHKFWYEVTIGHYDTFKQALTAQNQLPFYLKKLHPWIKPILLRKLKHTIASLPDQIGDITIKITSTPNH